MPPMFTRAKYLLAQFNKVFVRSQTAFRNIVLYMYLWFIVNEVKFAHELREFRILLRKYDGL